MQRHLCGLTALFLLVAARAGAQDADPFSSLASPEAPAGIARPAPRPGLPSRPPPETREVAAGPSLEAPPGLALEPAPALAVVRYEPQGSEVRSATVLVEFNQPMVEASVLEHDVVLVPPFSLEPPIPGRFAWIGTATAVFVAERGLPPGAELHVLVPAGLHATSGRRLEIRHAWSFRTAKDLAPVSPGAPGGPAPGLAAAPLHPPLPPLPRLAPEGSPSDALPGLEGWPPGEEPWADLSLVAENPALAPGTMLFLRIAVRDGLGRPCAAGLTVTARSEGAAAPFLQRGDLATGEDGFLDVEIPMPAEEDFGRVDVVAAAPDHLVAESSLRIWVRAPVELHPLLPGFLRAGDQVRVAALARSRAPGPVSALFRVRSAGAGALSDPVPVTLEPGVTRIVEAPAEATVVGEAVFQLALAAPGPDAGLAHQEVRVPVLRPGPLLRGAALGAVEGAVGIPVQRPGGFLAGSGRLEVEFTADPRIALEEPLRDLLTDSTGSAEVLAGRIRVLAALYRDPGVFPRGGVEDPAEARARLAEDLSRLLSGQREDGGFGPWPDARGSEPVASARVAEALRAARDVLDGGEAPGVGREALDMALDGVLRFLAAAVDGEQGGATERGDPAARALVLRSLALSGVPAPRAADGLYAELRDPDGPGSPQARAWLLEALHAADPEDVRVEELVAALRGAAVEGSGGAVIPDPGQVIPGRPVDLAGAAVVHALLSTRPGDTMIPRLAAGLLSGTVGGRWSGSEAGAWALQALALYYRGLERPRQELEARAWVADRMILGERFRRLEDRGRISLPLEELPGTGPMTVRVGVRGTSRIFWRVALEGVEAAVFRLGEDRGIRVERELTRVMGGPAPLRTDAGQWTLPLGAFVRERLRIVVSGPRRRVWVDAPLPAGLVPAEEAGAVMAPGTWDHVDAGPEGTRLARETLPPGVYEHSRLLRAVSPGDFVYPAARAWCLSEPGVSGRGPSERLVVTAPVPRVD